MFRILHSGREHWFHSRDESEQFREEHDLEVGDEMGGAANGNGQPTKTMFIQELHEVRAVNQSLGELRAFDLGAGDLLPLPRIASREPAIRFVLEARDTKKTLPHVRNLPAEIAAKIDRLRDSDVILSAILEQFASDSVITPMKQTDELYVSHYNKDYGGDHGLFTRHYDGNLRFMPVGAVVRALIYLQSVGTYKVVFGDSRVEKAFQTYDFGLLDFHKELHWVEGEYQPSGEPRILLKCNYLNAQRKAELATRALLAANTAVFYVVKAAMEYSKITRNPLQRAV